jgi:hypothetical protein
MTGPIRRRLFVMGCSRSGTTLLQRMLAAHSRIHTFPETGVFLKALGMRGRELPWTRLGLTLGKERKALAALRRHSDLPPERFPALPPRRWRLDRSVADVVGFLDELARAHGADHWLEKTPRHVLHAARIQELVPDAFCIHVVRDGRDVVASIVDRARRFPDRFRRQEAAEYGIRQWNRSLRATQAVMGKPGHLVVIYEALVQDPEETLRTICDLLELPYEPAMLDTPEEAGFVRAQEAWKADVSAPVRAAASKFPQVFDDAAQRRIEEQLRMASFHELRERAASHAPASLWAPWAER